jgi:hypothetical protein
MRRTTWQALLAAAMAITGLLTSGATPAGAAASVLQQLAPVAAVLLSAPVEFSVKRRPDRGAGDDLVDGGGGEGTDSCAAGAAVACETATV